MTAAILGFLAPFLPDVLGIGKGWMDHKAELQMMELRLKNASQEHEWRLQEIEIESASKDLMSARKQRESYGVQILNAAHDAEHVVSRWIFSAVFLVFAGLDWFISSVRPTVTYYVVGLWGAVKVALIVAAYRETLDVIDALTRPEIWTEFDQDVLLMILAFWFSDAVLRRRKAGSR